MSRADEIRAQAQRVAAKPANRSKAGRQEQLRRSVAPRSRTKPVGKTLNLDSALNSDIQRWQNDTATSMGMPRVTFQQTVDALLRELLADNGLADRVRERITKTEIDG